jgi:hypothetical protein
VTPRVHHRPRPCARCGETFTPRRADSIYCGGTCRVATHRERQRVTALGRPNSNGACNGYRAVVLTADLREWLRREVDKRRREQLERERAEQAAQDKLTSWEAA